MRIKSKSIFIRVSPDEKKSIQKSAEDEGRSLSEYIWIAHRRNNLCLTHKLMECPKCGISTARKDVDCVNCKNKF